MTVSVEQFVRQLVESGLMSEADINAFLAELPADRKPEDGKQLARQLAKQQKITGFQAQAVYEGKWRILFLGNYVVLDKLGQGGMGMVFKAHHKTMNRVVAVKVLAPSAMKSPDAVKRFHREVEAAARIMHPNIVKAYDAGESNKTHFLVMEFVDGSDLSQVVKKQGPLPAEKAVQCILQAGRGLEAAHEAGIVHRDIKPANLLLDKVGVVKILDMGLARLDETGGNAGMTQTGAVMGTVDYMSPEQALNTKYADARSDIYSLGCSLYFLLTGQVPFPGGTLMEKLMAHREQPIPALRALCPAASPALEAVYRNMLAKDPAHRYQTMRDAMHALELSLTDAGTESDSGLVNFAAAPELDSELFSFIRNEQLAAQREVALATAPVATDESTDNTQTRTPTSNTIRQGAARNSVVPEQIASRKPLVIGGAAAGLALLLGVWLLFHRGGGDGAAPENETNESDSATINATTSNQSNGDAKPPETKIAVASSKGAPAVASSSTMPVGSTTNAQTTGASTDFLLEFDGVDDYVDVPSLRYDGSHPLTIEAYFQCGPVIRPHQVVLRGYWDADLSLYLNANTPFAAFAEKFDDAMHRLAVGNVPVEVRKRCHVAAVVDSKTARMYIDGKFIRQSVRSSSPVNSVAEKIFIPENNGKPTFLIGNNPPGVGSNSCFAGQIDEIRVSRVARYEGNFSPSRRFEPDADTLALYHFDEGTGDQLRDSSGNNHHGRILGGPKWVNVPDATAFAGRGNSALDFAGPADGDGPHVAVPISGQTDEPLTIEMNVTARSEAAASNRGLLVFLGGRISLKQWSDRWNWIRTLDDGTYDQISFPIELGRRVNLTAVLSEDQMRLFVDGRLVGQIPKRPRTAPKYDSLRIGGSARSASWAPFDGTIDELRISRTARYAADFVPAGRFETDADTVALYHFEEGSGDVLRDSSGNNRHGTIVGAKWVRLGEGTASPSVDLLAAVDPGRDAIAGPWSKEGGKLIAPDQQQAGLRNPRIKLPFVGSIPAEYDVDLVAERKQQGGNGLVFGFVMGGRQATLNMDSYSNPYLWGIDDIDGQGAKLNVTRNPGQRFALNVPTPVRIEVRKTSIRAYCGSEKVVAWQGNPTQLSTNFWAVPDKQSLFLGSQSIMHVSAIRLTPVAAESATSSSATMASTVLSAPPIAKAPFDAAQARDHQEAWARYLGVPVEFTNSIGMKFVLIPPGEFLMGGSEEEISRTYAENPPIRQWWDDALSRSELPRHRVILTKAVYLGAFPTTQADYERLSGSNPSAFSANGAKKEAVAGKDTSRHPVEMVSWNDAAVFCAKLSQAEGLNPFYTIGENGVPAVNLAGNGYRLSSEAEWEFACRAGTQSAFWFGDDVARAGEHFWYARNSGKQTHPVGELNSNPLGLYDMHGPVWQVCHDPWAADYYASFGDCPAIDPLGPPVGQRRTVRGGFWDSMPMMCRSATRSALNRTTRLDYVGFRVVVPVESVKSRAIKPAASVQAGSGPAPFPLARSAGLQFDGLQSVVALPSLRYGGSTPLTLEAVATPEPVDSFCYIVTDVELGGLGIRINKNRWEADVNGLAPATVSWSKRLEIDANSRKTHVALIRDNYDLRLFVDGKLVAEGSATMPFKQSLEPFCIGAQPAPTRPDKYSHYFKGVVHSVRISKSARYGGEFPPPDRFDSDAETLALYNMNEGQGETLTDSSGNGHHGKITGAKWLRAHDAPSAQPRH